MSPRILIVDANSRMRRTIRQVVEDSTDLQVCGEGTDGQDAIRKAEPLKADLVILDLTDAEDEWIASGASHQEAAAQGASVLFSLEENQLVRNAAKAALG